MQIRAIMLYEFRKGTNAAEASRSICQVFGEHKISETTCKTWFVKFRSGDFSLSDAPRSGRPTAIVEADLLARVESNRQLTTRELAEDFEVSHTTIENTLHRLGMVSKLNNWVPHELTERNKLDRMSKCASLLARHHVGSFWDRLITCDEKWVFYNNLVRKREWCAPGQAAGSTPKKDIHGKKIMLCIWWGISGIIHYELLSPSQTISSDVYVNNSTGLTQL